MEFFHTAAAKFTQQPLLIIDKNEAETLAQAVVDVFAQYELEVSPKVAAWVQLIGVCGTIYGVRYFAYVQHQATLKKEAQAGNNVHPFPNTSLN